MKEKILIFGNGQIGNFYLDFFKEKKISSKISLADITKINQIQKAIKSFRPTVVINTAAITSLEECEKNMLEAFNVNVLGARNVAQVCDENNIYFIHFSSGCIFSSKNEKDLKKENDIPDPVSYYSWTKVWSEQLVKYNRSKKFKYLILRPRQPISSQISPKNMLVKMLTFTRFIDVPNNGTIIEDLMQWTLELIEKRYVGTVNASNSGWSTPYRIAKMLKKYVLPDLPIIKISKEELNKLTPVKRIDTILDNTLLKTLVKNVPDYNKRMEDIIKDLSKNIKNANKKQLKNILVETVKQSKQRTIVNNVWKELLK